MGTPFFAVPILKSLYQNGYPISVVYTRPPQKSQRGQKINKSPIQGISETLNLEFRTPTSLKNNKEEYKYLKELNADIAIVVAYGQIIPNEILNLTKKGFINIHASLLPKWRGAAPIHRSIMNGDTSTGISIMRLVEGLDEGPTYIQSEIGIEQNNTYEDVYNNLIDVGKQTLDIFFSGHTTYSPVPQNHKLATYAKKITKDEMRINFSDTAFLNHKKVCAFSPKPGAWFECNSQKYKIFSTEIITENNLKNFFETKKLILPFKKDYLIVKKIQKEARDVMTIEDFERGYPEEFNNIKKNFKIK